VKSVLQEIHGRSLWQIFGLYLASSWVVLQVVDTLDGVVGLPAWVGTAALGLLLAGLPIVMVTAFVQRGWGRGGVAGSSDSGETVAGGEVGDRRPAVERDAGMPKAAPESAARRRLFSWRNALVGGLGAFALLGIGTAVWLVMRTAGIGPAGTLVARGVLDEADVIILADFENSTNDETLSGVVTEALRVDLSQSEAVELADPGFIASALGRMERDPATLITEAVAFDVARREGAKAVVTGEVARAGVGYVLTVGIIEPGTGDVLLSHREAARDSTGLLEAIDALGRHLRERVGDPLKSISTSPPLEQVTTSNLEALRSYSQAVRLPQADAARRIDLLEAAVAADTTFAMAWNALSTQLSNYGVEPGRAMEARARSFNFRENLPTAEQNFVSAMYYLSGTYEPRQAIPYMEAIVEADPTAAGPINNLGEAYRNLGDLDRAIELYERAIAADSSRSAIPFMNIAQVKTTQGDVEGAMRAAEYLETYGGEPFPDWHRTMATGGTGDYEAAEVTSRAALETIGGRPFLLAQGTQWLGAIVGVRGRVAESVESWTEAGRIQAENGSSVEALRNVLAAAVIEGVAYLRDDAGAIDVALATYPIDEMDPVERPLLDLAEGYALLGDPTRARELLAEFEATTPELHQRGLRHHRHGVIGQIALREGRFEEAIEEFRQSASRPQELEPMVGLARAFDGAGQPDSARVHYRRFLEAPHWLSIIPHSKFLANALTRAAELEYEAGNLREAAAYLARFVDLWAAADPGLQPRVQAAQSRLQEILDEIG